VDEDRIEGVAIRTPAPVEAHDRAAWRVRRDDHREPDVAPHRRTRDRALDDRSIGRWHPMIRAPAQPEPMQHAIRTELDETHAARGQRGRPAPAKTCRRFNIRSTRTG
jgi:hypothetical protein